MIIKRIFLPVLAFGLFTGVAAADTVFEGAADVTAAGKKCEGVQKRDFLTATLLPKGLKGNPKSTTLAMVVAGKTHSMTVDGKKTLASGKKKSVSFVQDDGLIGSYKMTYKAKSMKPKKIKNNTKEVTGALELKGFGGVKKCTIKFDLIVLQL